MRQNFNNDKFDIIDNFRGFIDLWSKLSASLIFHKIRKRRILSDKELSNYCLNECSNDFDICVNPCENETDCIFECNLNFDSCRSSCPCLSQCPNGCVNCPNWVCKCGIDPLSSSDYLQCEVFLFSDVTFKV